MKKIINKLLEKFGYKIIKTHLIENQEKRVQILSKDDLLGSFYSLLTKINFIPQHIVDIGANHGSWTRKTINYFPEAYYTLMEPQQKMQNSIQDILKVNNKVSFHALGAGDKAGSFKFTIVDRDDSCSFIYSEEQAINAGYTQINIPVVTLNDFLPTLKLGNPEIIKIDAEGLDLEVLAGASNYFGKTEIFMVEAGVMNKLYNNTVLDVIVFMDNKNYQLFDFTDLNRTIKNNALWLVEMVFIKRGGFIDSAINSYN